MKSIAQKQQDVILEFSRLPTWEERYRHIIELGKKLPPLDNQYKIEKNKVRGCQSQVWMHAFLDDKKNVHYLIESDAMIVNGLAAILKSLFSGHAPQEVIDAPIQFLSDMGLTQHLSQSRANGLGAMVRQFKNYALAFAVMSKNEQTS